jgi:hypothetical protein
MSTRRSNACRMPVMIQAAVGQMKKTGFHHDTQMQN